MTPVIDFLKHLVHRERWFTFSLVTAIPTWLIAFAIGVPILLLVQAEPMPDRPVGQIIFSALVLAPVLENLLMVVLMALARNVGGVRFSIAVMVFVIVVLHAVSVSWRAIAATIAFPIYGASYMAWRPSGATRAYWITVLQHVLFNVPSTAAAVFLP